MALQELLRLLMVPSSRIFWFCRKTLFVKSQSKQILRSEIVRFYLKITMTKRVLMVLTNHGEVEGTDVKTGWYLPECAHPYARFAKAGYHIECASIHGGACPVTPASLDLADTENREFWENSELRALTENTKVLSECKASEYDLVFFVGGFGTMWDFPYDTYLATLAQEIYEKGGFVGAVCHGPIALTNVKLSNGEYLIAGKEVTAFCNEEEEIAGLVSHLPEHAGLGRTCEDIFRARGANYTKGAAWEAHIAVADRVFTGQNPASAGPVAEAIVQALSA